MTGPDVLALENFLVAAHVGSASAKLAAHRTTDYFGPLTVAALIEYQKANGISPAVGYFGPLTRAYVMSHE